MNNPLKVEGSFNIRELGGHQLGNEAKTCERILIRAGNLDQLPLTSQEQLIDYGVKTVIDLRDEWEAEQYPNVFAESKDVKYLNLPLIGNALSNDETWKQETEKYDLLSELYNKYLDHCQSQIGAIISAIAESEPTIIFHCYAGKDRTGIIAGLLLALAAVPDEIIAEDYSQSKQEILHLIEQWREYAVQHERNMQDFERDVASEISTMLEMLNYIKSKYGNVANYMRACGLEDAQLVKLRSLLILKT